MVRLGSVWNDLLAMTEARMTVDSTGTPTGCCRRPASRRRLGIALAAAACLSLQISGADSLNPAVTVSVDASANRHAISPQVYGVAFASTAQLSDLNVPVNR